MTLHADAELWVAVFDGAKALIFRNAGPRSALRLTLVDQLDQTNPPDRDQTSDAPGRFPDGAARGGGQNLPAGAAAGASAVDQASRHDRAERAFAAQLMNHLDAQAAAGRFAQLILIGAPRALGAARPHVGAALKPRILHEDAADLVNAPTTAIAAHAQALLPV